MVHEWLVNYAGSERALEQLLALLPGADLFAVVDFVPEHERAFLGGRRARTTFVQRLPFARSRYRSYLPLMPLAVEQLDLSGYDLVVSSNHAVAKGVLTDPDALHLCYCYSPLRYAWDLQHEYLREAGLDRRPTGLLARAMLHRLRLWDARSSAGVDRFVAISAFIARRIAKAYRRTADVIYPPVDTETFTPAPAGAGGPTPDGGGPYYVTSSRFVPYKRIPLLVEAFRLLPDRRLVVVGDGPEWEAAKRAAGPNVSLLGYRPRDEMREWLRGARAYLFAAVEDFGIAPVEAQACGTPVIAYARGALRETIPGLDAEAPCGVLYEDATPDGVARAVRLFEAEAARITADACRRNAERFSVAAFRDRMGRLLAAAYAAHRASLDDAGARRESWAD